MPKGKVIDVRPKKRKHSQKSEEHAGPVVPEKPTRNPQHFPQSSTDRMRLNKSRNRNHADKRNLFDIPIGGKFPVIVCVVAVIIVAGGFIAHQYTVWRHAKLVVTPLSLPRVIEEESNAKRLFWGTYRPGLYFGLTHRSQDSLLVGLVWSVQDSSNLKFRHACDSNDGVLSYNWIEHDGSNFGTQQIVDTDHIITVSFVKRQDSEVYSDWTFRVSAVSRNLTQPAKPLMVIAYFHYSGDSTRYSFFPLIKKEVIAGIEGNHVELGDHRILLHPAKQAIQTSHLVTHTREPQTILESLYTGLALRRDNNLVTLTKARDTPSSDLPQNTWFQEVTVLPPPVQHEGQVADVSKQMVMEVEFSKSKLSNERLTGVGFDEQLSKLSKAFHQRYSQKFQADTTKFTERQVKLAKIAVSNLLGGIGYFYGSSLMQSAHTGPDPVPMWPTALFSATPSRPMFPRGFLWDEGFHGLILARWDPELAMESVGHWLDLMNGEGWIPREQILGSEARSRVPEEFIVQRDTVANPPALVMVIDALMDGVPKFTTAESTRFRHWAALVLPRLHTWYQWFNRTQSGPVPLSYRWRGRDASEVTQLNPLTLSSGLDDYPRASHPTTSERHLDLRCWMTLFARVTARLASLVAQYAQMDAGPTRMARLEEARRLVATYGHWADLLSNPASLDQLHWSTGTERYADYGLHTDAVRLQLPERDPRHPRSTMEELKAIRVVDKPPTLQLVTSSYGYVNLFPMLLRLLPPTSPQLPILLRDLASREMWTDYGIRSLSTNSPLYRKSNRKEDPPYWRGSIWLNMNYLTVRSLRYYATNPRTPASVAKEAGQLADRLAQNLVSTVLGDLEKTGFLWEQYDDMTGRGQRAHPFSGWTALVSLLMDD